MASSSPNNPFPSTSYAPKYDTWPYDASEFQRYDENADGDFYQQPRLVTHIDDPAIARLTQYYDTVLPRNGKIMDMCTSWKSFYPSTVKEAIQRGELEVFGVGLNKEEMALNAVFLGKQERWRVLDLNVPPHDVRAGWEGEDLQFDATTCVVSVDYLNKPLEVCRKLLESTKEGGKVHLVISNRCFPNKVVRRWLMLDERSRLEFVGGKLSEDASGDENFADFTDYLHFSGWKNVEIVDLCARDENGMRVTDDQGTVLIRSPHLPDHLDPLWIVRATKHA
jgi:SAM-dependent methyltransferase